MLSIRAFGRRGLRKHRSSIVGKFLTLDHDVAGSNPTVLVHVVACPFAHSLVLVQVRRTF